MNEWFPPAFLLFFSPALFVHAIDWGWRVGIIETMDQHRLMSPWTQVSIKWTLSQTLSRSIPRPLPFRCHSVPFNTIIHHSPLYPRIKGCPPSIHFFLINNNNIYNNLPTKVVYRILSSRHLSSLLLALCLLPLFFGALTFFTFFFFLADLSFVLLLVLAHALLNLFLFRSPFPFLAQLFLSSRLSSLSSLYHSLYTLPPSPSRYYIVHSIPHPSSLVYHPETTPLIPLFVVVYSFFLFSFSTQPELSSFTHPPSHLSQFFPVSSHLIVSLRPNQLHLAQGMDRTLQYPLGLPFRPLSRPVPDLSPSHHSIWSAIEK